MRVLFFILLVCCFGFSLHGSDGGRNGCNNNGEEKGRVEEWLPISMNIDYISVKGISCYGMNDGEIEVVLSGNIFPCEYPVQYRLERETVWGGYVLIEETGLINNSSHTFNNLSAGVYSVSVFGEDPISGGICYVDDISNIGIYEPAPLNAGIVTTNVTEGTNGNDGSVVANVSGGNPPYFFQWSTGGNNGSDLYDLSEGEYSLTVEDVNGCIDSVSATVYAPRVDLMPGEACRGEEVFFDVRYFPSGNMYEYFVRFVTASGFKDVNAFYNDFAGILDVEVPFDAVTGFVEVFIRKWNNEYEVETPPYVLLIKDEVEVAILGIDSMGIYCGDESLTVSASVGGGSFSARYDDPFGTSVSPNVFDVNSGVFDFGHPDMVYQNGVAEIYISYDYPISGCASQPAMEVILVYESPGFIVNIDNSCFGGSNGGIELVPLAASNPFIYDYQWSIGSTSNVISELSAGVYDVTVENAGGCREVRSFLVEELDEIEVLFTVSHVTQGTGGMNGSVSADASGGITPYSYNWYAPNGFLFIGENITGLIEGEYFVEVVDAYGCFATFSVEVHAPRVTGYSPYEICRGDTLEFEVANFPAGSYDVQFSGAASTQVVLNGGYLAQGVLSVEVPDDAETGVVNFAIDDFSVSYVVESPPTPIVVADDEEVFIFGLDSMYCSEGGTDVLIGVPGGGEFSWTYLWGIPGDSSVLSPSGVFNPENLIFDEEDTVDIVVSYMASALCPSSVKDSIVKVFKSPEFYSMDYVGGTLSAGSPLVDLYSVFDFAPWNIDTTGGVFSGVGVMGNVFSPSLAGEGTHLISYTLSNGDCETNLSDSITVVPAQFISGLAANYCENEGVAVIYPDATLVDEGYYFTGVGTNPSIYDYHVSLSGGNAVFDPLLNSASSEAFEVEVWYGNGIDSFSVSQLVMVAPIPLINIFIDDTVCVDASSFPLEASPSGGNFYIDGVAVVSDFDPAALGVGEHDVMYDYDDAAGCSSTAIKSVYVRGLPEIKISGLSSGCHYDTIFLEAIPVGGEFSIKYPNNVVSSGVSSFVATMTGEYEVTYSYIDSVGCENVGRDTLMVNGLPMVGIDGLSSSYCVGDEAVPLVGEPSGGFFEIKDVSNNVVIANVTQFVPVSVGAYEITYHYVDGNTSCTDSVMQSVEVHDLPGLSINGLSSAYCLDGSAVYFSGEPSGGTFEVMGPDGMSSVVGTSFIPYMEGDYFVEYAYTNGNGCRDSIVEQFVVDSLPLLSIDGLDTAYCLNVPSVPLVGNFSSGTFKVRDPNNGIVLNAVAFTPSIEGNYEVTYSYVDGNGCENEVLQNVYVRSLPEVSINTDSLKGEYCLYDEPSTLLGTPIGGDFTVITPSFDTLENVSVFEPFDEDSYEVIYTYTDTNFCTNVDVEEVLVKPLPDAYFIDLDTAYCTSDPTVVLKGSYSPLGEFSIFGDSVALIDTDIFVPGILDTGSYLVTYEVTHPNTQCMDFDSLVVDVYATPELTIVGLNAEYCLNDSSVSLVGIPAGGSFTILDPDLVLTGGSTTFSPEMDGWYEITYTYEHPITGCGNSLTQAVEVEVLPVVSIEDNLEEAYCWNEEPELLVGEPTGGEFMVVTPSNDTLEDVQFFIPAEVGFYEVVYSYTSVVNCTDIASKMVRVDSLPGVKITNLDTVYCTNSNQVVLAGNYSQGYFSIYGDLVALENVPIFSPSSLGEGEYMVTYTAIDLNTTCWNSDTVMVEVFEEPYVEIVGLDSIYCQYGASVPLEGNYYPDGVFEVIDPLGGITPNATVFTPSILGDYQVIYTYEADYGPIGCSSSIVEVVKVVANPVVQILDLESFYCWDTVPVPLVGEPSGGEFWVVDPDGNMMTVDSSFIPSIVGDYTVYYAYQEGGGIGCADTVSADVVVRPLPIVNIIGLDAAGYCRGGPSVTVYGNESPSGTFTMIDPNGDTTTSVGSIIFDPTMVGTYTIIYEFTDPGTSCTDRDVESVIVYSLPNVEILTVFNSVYCLGDSIVPPLVGSPSGGYFTIVDPFGGITPFATEFSPFIPGDFEVTYTYVQNYGNGVLCDSSVSATIRVDSLPAVDIDGSLLDEYCLFDDDVPLLGTPSGGYFTVKAPSPNDSIWVDSIFSPVMPGLYEVTYHSTEGCNDVAVRQVIVHPLPVGLEFIGLDSSYCNNDGLVPLDAYPSPLNGSVQKFNIYDLTGVLLAPNVTNFETGDYVGEHVFEFEFTDNEGCVSSISKNVVFFRQPTADFSIAGSCVDSTIVFLDNSISGDSLIRTYGWTYLNISDTGTVHEYISGDTIAFDVTHTVSDSAGCSDAITIPLVIGANPVFSYEVPVICLGDTANFHATSVDGEFELSEFDAVTHIYYSLEEGLPLIDNPDTTAIVEHVYGATGVYDTYIEVSTNLSCSKREERTVVVVPRVDEYPYCQDFEAGEVGWYVGSDNFLGDTLWKRGVALGGISDGHGKVWVTAGSGLESGLTAGYSEGEDAWVYGPCFDITKLLRPMMSLDIWCDTKEDFDGAVVEVSRNGFDWVPLGKVDDGLNWYGSPEIYGTPGAQVYAPPIKPIGWSGNSNGWRTARYKLDEYRSCKELRVRVAFGSDESSLVGTSYRGFAFDNFCVKEREGCVLLEHVNGTAVVDDSLYRRCLAYDLNAAVYNNLDVVLVQYDSDFGNLDDYNARASEYGIIQNNRVRINGRQFNSGHSNDWRQEEINAEMLREPLFSIDLGIDTSAYTASARVIALVDTTIAAMEDVYLHMVIVEDSTGVNGRTYRNVMQKMLPDQGGVILKNNWLVGDTVDVVENWGFQPVEGHTYFGVAFIQNDQNKEVYQVETSQEFEFPPPPIDTTISTVVDNGVVQSFTLYPNPTSQEVNIKFGVPHSEVFDWRVFDAVGRCVDLGRLPFGVQDYAIGTGDLPNGVYFLVLAAEGSDVVLQERFVVIH